MKTSMKGSKMSYKKAIFLVVLTLLVAMFSFDNGYAVTTYLDTDTIKIIDAYGEPGDTNVIVNFYFANTVHIAGWSIRVVFDTSLIKPTHDELGKLNAELIGQMFDNFKPLIDSQGYGISTIGGPFSPRYLEFVYLTSLNGVKLISISDTQAT